MSRAEAAQRGVKPTLRTIADISGLAVPTVSRALNDAPDIGAKTKERVRKIADEIGYVPNRAGVRLRTGRTNVIAIAMSTDYDLTNHSGRLISSIAEQLDGTNLHLNFTPYVSSGDAMRPLRYLVENRMADALILNQTQNQDPRVAYLMERGVPFVTHGRTDWCAQHAYYDTCNRAVGELMIKALSRRGRKRVLIIAPPVEHKYGQDLCDGAAEAANAAGVELVLEKTVTSDSRRKEVMAAVTASLEADPNIDAIIAASNSAAMSATGALEAFGRTLGDDIDLVAKETTSQLLQLFRPQMLLVREDVSEAGSFIGRAAIQAVREPHKPPMQYVNYPTEDDLYGGA